MNIPTDEEMMILRNHNVPANSEDIKLFDEMMECTKKYRAVKGWIDERDKTNGSH